MRPDFRPASPCHRLPHGTILARTADGYHFRTSDHRWYSVDPAKLPQVRERGDLIEALLAGDPDLQPQYLDAFFSLDAASHATPPPSDSVRHPSPHVAQCTPEQSERYPLHSTDPQRRPRPSAMGLHEVHGAGVLADAIRRALVNADTEATVTVRAVIAASDDHPGTGWLQLDEQMHAQPDVAWMRTYVDGRYLVVEPVSMGGDRSSHGMTQARLVAAAEHPDLITADVVARGGSWLTAEDQVPRLHGANRLPVAESSPSLADRAAHFVVSVLQTESAERPQYSSVAGGHAVAGDGRCKVGMLRRLNLVTFAVSDHPVLPIPACEDYRPGARA